MPRTRSTGFGSYHGDFTPLSEAAPHTDVLRAGCFRFGSPAERVNLATVVHSLLRFSKRTFRPRHSASLQPFPAAPSAERSLQAETNCHQRDSGSFHNPRGLLFTFPSRYWYAIGLGTCLGLGVGASQVPREIPIPGTLRSPDASRHVAWVRDCHPLRSDVPVTVLLRPGETYRCAENPHPHVPRGTGFRLPCAVFVRHY